MRFESVIVKAARSASRSTSARARPAVPAPLAEETVSAPSSELSACTSVGLFLRALPCRAPLFVCSFTSTTLTGLLCFYTSLQGGKCQSCAWFSLDAVWAARGLLPLHRHFRISLSRSINRSHTWTCDTPLRAATSAAQGPSTLATPLQCVDSGNRIHLNIPLDKSGTSRDF